MGAVGDPGRYGSDGRIGVPGIQVCATVMCITLNVICNSDYIAHIPAE